MREYGRRFTCILCSSNIKSRHLRGCVSGTRCHQIHIAKETAEISLCYVCQAVFIYFRQNGEDHDQNILTGDLYQNEREKNISFAFQGIASPYPNWGHWQLQYKETRSWHDQQSCGKKTLIHIILNELFCIYTTFTKMEAGWGSLHNLYILCLFLLLFVTISHLLCWLFFYLWNVFIFSESIC